MSDTTMTTSDGITAREFGASSDVHDAFPVLGDGATAFFPTESLAASARFVHAISEIEGIEDHRPDLDVRPHGVTVRLITREPEWWGMTHRDLVLARRILEIARAIGLRPESSSVQCVDPIVIGAVDIDRIRPFWAALLGYVERPDSPKEDLVDPRRRSPGLWFETMDVRPEGRNRMHVAVWVPFEEAEARVAAAVSAGGEVIYSKAAPSWWTLADPEGNEADVATIKNRD
jgi:4a-hydroxytetrahydrobiopterin dehydratase